MKSINFLLLFTSLYLFSISLTGQESMKYYLPEGVYDSSIPTPLQVLGYDVGEWHVSHDQLIYYLRMLDAASDRIEMHEYARSHEGRPLFILMISSAENLARKDQIRQAHVQLTEAHHSDNVDLKDLPAVLYQGYSIHGNEPSGANAGLVNAYYLAACQSPQAMHTLKNTFILMDPCYNPDGFNRFASWANTHKSKTLVSDPISRELNEVWPRGRTNHYWADLNRDWLLLTHPESQGRLRVYHDWKPNVLTDHHEMGTNSTFFFQPGIPSRTNPNTPQLNQDLTEKIGTFHAKALDSIGSLYYTKASFDDYYYGKGSTYPDANGAIGILFEQASSRGHLQESANGLLSFPFTIRNQFVTSLSTQKAVSDMRRELLEYKRKFFKDQEKAAKSSKVKGYIVMDKDKGKMAHFHRIFSAHKIDMYRPEQDVMADGVRFTKENAIYVPLDQQQYLVAKTLFEKVNSFPDSLFYDVSTWTFPLACNVKYAALTSAIKVGQKIVSMDAKGSLTNTENAYAFIMDWTDYNAPAALYEMMNRGELLTKVINNPFSLSVGNRIKNFSRGDIVIAVQNQKMKYNELVSFLEEIANVHHVDIYGVNTGWADNNMTLGNPDVTSIDVPSIAMIVGEGVDSYDAGEIWHQIDTRYRIPLTMIDKRQLFRMNLGRYTTLILTDGQYNDFEKRDVEKIKEWASNGGTLILFGSAIDWGRGQNLFELVKVEQKSPSSEKDNSYAKVSTKQGATLLAGAIFETKMDITHPLCYGYDDDKLMMFRRGTTFYELPNNAYASPLKYTAAPGISGYIPRGMEKIATNKPAVTVHRIGSGRAICLQDNVLFRGYWYGGSKLFANALFFSSTLDRQTLAKD